MRLEIPKSVGSSEFVLPSYAKVSDDGETDNVRPVITVSKLSKKVAARIQDEAIRVNRSTNDEDNIQFSVHQNTVKLHTVRASIVGWNGVFNEDGSVFVFDGKAETVEKLLDAMSQSDYDALVEFCEKL